MSRAPTRPQIMPVVILALVLLAVLKANDVRLGFSGADAAPPTPARAPGDAAPALAQTAPPPALPSSQSDAERRLLEQLAERRLLLDRRESELDTREKLLAAMELRAEARFAALDRREAELAEMEARELARQTQEYAALSSAYERMKARDAAQIFDTLEEDILVPVAAGMRTQSLAGVLAEMKPDKARRLTILLAERSRRTAAAGTR